MSRATTVKIDIEGKKIKVTSPYHPDFPKSAAQIGGRWNGRQWIFDSRDETRVRDLCFKIYGTDGRPVPLVTVRHQITSEEARESELYIGGRCVVKRWNRDSAPRLGVGVIVVEGQFPARGGSRKYPLLQGEGVILEIRDIPRSLVSPEDKIV